jgi:hypothetical protein
MFSSRKQRIADLILQATVQGQIISEALTQQLPAVQEVSPTPLPVISEFQNPHQINTAKAATKYNLIFNMNIPSGFAGIVREVANTYYYNPTTNVADKLYWLIDNRQIYNAPIQREIASINSPKKCLFVSQQAIKWVCENDDSTDHLYEILCDGFTVSLTDLPAALQLVARGVL